ncbi:hypothetical protein [bacterium endosymbiont of Pedicinus badii]|uniref:CAF17-like 4Fe-4S cluster assembly/insertion protein YgfZ n=1 Tax=bacterium endosymbiont of Pedicinus badii TaxID=1719126 RepID=UPI0009B95D94|nr:hypothetical protein [bacterium endosymbiont of Pedicinus badii]OQM34010.1 hypothetical protein AOQ89_01460 [bacterium endosymbiont of Pedicinus badii]
MKNNLEKENFIIQSKNLHLRCIEFKNLQIIKTFGKDCIKYLQSQFSCNIEYFKNLKYKICTHCNNSGKLITDLSIILFKNSVFYILRKELFETHIKELKKYSIFSDIKFEKENKQYIFGLVGKKSKIIIKNFFNIFHFRKKIIKKRENFLVLFKKPKERFLLILERKTSLKFKEFLSSKKIILSKEVQWDSLNIECGYPIIKKNTSIFFSPHELNFSKLGSISYKKGCYLGQEQISKIRHKKIFKKSLYWLYGYSKILPNPKDILQVQVKKGIWKNCGHVLFSCKKNKKITWIQAVLKNISYKKKFIYFPKEKNSIFFIKKKFS